MPKCSACGAAIEWVTTTSGKKMPCDAGEFPFIVDRAGKIVAVLSDGRVASGRTCAESYEGEAYVYARLSHFATCPAAESFRRKNKT